MLTTVTITGADDRTDPAALVALSKEYPFIEWGLLLSVSRLGTPRYPSRAWLTEFELVARETKAMRYAVHFCGQCTRDTLEGKTTWLDDIDPGRIQLNGFKPTATFIEMAKRLLPARPTLSFILQARSTLQLAFSITTARQIGGATSVLYDPSGGTGQAPERWPNFVWLPYGTEGGVGYAGGIGPANVESVLKTLHEPPDRGNFWIDMESRVRSDDNRLDLARVRSVLEVVARCMKVAA